MRTFVHVQKCIFGPAFSADHRRLLTITDDYSVHQLSHNAVLVLYQRPWTITNVSSRTLWCDGAFSKSHTHISSTHTHTHTHTLFKVSFSLSLSLFLSLSLSHTHTHTYTSF